MQDNLTQVPVQPFFKLAQGNMDLVTRFMASPEVAADTTANKSQTFREAAESMTALMQTSAFTQMMRGMRRRVLRQAQPRRVDRVERKRGLGHRSGAGGALAADGPSNRHHHQGDRGSGASQTTRRLGLAGLSAEGHCC